MARAQLGEDFDVHGGGLDLIFPHHENERAQSEAAGERFARAWMHNGMLRLTGEKMSKSLGNIDGLAEALERVGRETLLVFFAQAHYRSPVDYSDATLEQASATAAGLREALRNARRYAAADGSRRRRAHPHAGRRRLRALRRVHGRRPRHAARAGRAARPRARAQHRRGRWRGRIRPPWRPRPTCSCARSTCSGSPRSISEAETSEEALALAVERSRRARRGRLRARRRVARRDRGARLQRARHAAGAAGRAPRWLTAATSRPATTWSTGCSPCARRCAAAGACARSCARARRPRRCRGSRAPGVRMSIAVADRVTALAERPDHQGVVALCDPYPYADAGGAARAARMRSSSRSTASPTRATSAPSRAPASASGAHGLVIPRHGSAGVTAVVAKASAGAIEHLPIALVTNLAELLRRNKRADLWSYAAAEDADATPDALDLTGGVVLVLGAEGSGIRPLVRQRCDAARPHPDARADRLAQRRRRGVAAALRSRSPAPHRAPVTLSRLSANPQANACSCDRTNAPQRTCVLERTCYVRPISGSSRG